MDTTSTSEKAPPPAEPAAGTAPATSAAPVKGKAVRPGDKIFRGLSRGSGITLLVIMAAIAGFLAYRASIAVSKDSVNFLTAFEWNPQGDPPAFGIGVLAFGTIVSSLIAMVIAVPIAVGIALFISHYAPRRIAAPLAYVIDLLAAVPSIIYGLWGALFLVPYLDGLTRWLDEFLGWTTVFDMTNPGSPARSIFTVGILLAIMVLPIITNVTREVFLQAPKMYEEAALALGATRWETVRTSVLPFGRSGIISASMLGLGRALGETMAVATVLSPGFLFSLRVLDPGSGTFAQNIAAKFNEADDFGRDALIASGLVLFVITLLVNGAARWIIARRKEYSGANA
jgi:phosphate transport system permease protein